MHPLKDKKLQLIARILVFLQAAELIRVCLYFLSNGYLPAPFLHDKFDTFMDFFNPLYWSEEKQPYSVSKSYYPPLNFLILNLMSSVTLNTDISVDDAFHLREIYSGLIPIVSMFYLALATWSAYLVLSKETDKTNSLYFAVSFALSTPLLFAIERGNLIILTLPLLAFATLNRGWTHFISIAALINLKPYFVIIMLVHLILHDFEAFIKTLLVSILIFILTAALLNYDLFDMIENVFDLARSPLPLSGRAVLALPASIDAWSYSIQLALERTHITDQKHAFALIATVLKYLNWSIVAGALITLYARRRCISRQDGFAFAITLIPISTYAVGGYSILFLPFALKQLSRMRFKKIYLYSTILLFLSLNDISVLVNDMSYQRSFLAGTTVWVEYNVTFGAVLRPILATTIVIVWAYELFCTVPPTSSEQKN